MVLHTRGRVGRRQFSSIIRTSFSTEAERGFLFSLVRLKWYVLPAIFYDEMVL